MTHEREQLKFLANLLIDLKERIKKAKDKEKLFLQKEFDLYLKKFEKHQRVLARRMVDNSSTTGQPVIQSTPEVS